MCLILFALNPNDQFNLVLAANRDEQYGRPSRAANFWDDHPNVLAGRDLSAGGTWLGVTRNGRFAAVTNFREDPPHPIPPRSRGELTANFLIGNDSPHHYLHQVAQVGDEYRGFNLVVGDGNEYCYLSNREGIVRHLTSGCYGLSNQLLDCDWPKVIQGRNRLSTLAAEQMNSKHLYPLILDDGDERAFSQSFIRSERYGTTASTVLSFSQSGNVTFEERTFGVLGKPKGAKTYTFKIN
ncbi:MAG: NRDE family protein [Pseudomonadota bacterium]